MDSLLSQSKNLADVLKFAFDTPTGIPKGAVYINNNTEAFGSLSSGLAEFGTLVLEWTRLSDLTGDPQYANLTQKAQEYLLHPQPASSEPFPGLLGSAVNWTNGMFVDSAGGWTSGTDSFYEYVGRLSRTCDSSDAETDI